MTGTMRKPDSWVSGPESGWHRGDGKVPRTVGLGHDVVFQVSWNLGLPEEDHAPRLVRQRVTVGVELQKGSPGHIRKLQ